MLMRLRSSPEARTPPPPPPPLWAAGGTKHRKRAGWLGGTHLERAQSGCLLLPETDTRWRHGQGQGHWVPAGGQLCRQDPTGCLPPTGLPLSRGPETSLARVVRGSTAETRTSPGSRQASVNCHLPRGHPDPSLPESAIHAQGPQCVLSRVPEEPTAKRSNSAGADLPARQGKASLHPHSFTPHFPLGPSLCQARCRDLKLRLPPGPSQQQPCVEGLAGPTLQTRKPRLRREGSTAPAHSRDG